MRRFIVKFSLFYFSFLTLFFVIFYSLEYLPEKFRVGVEVDDAKSLATQTITGSSDTIRLGDSVGKNINNLVGYENNVLNITCNQAISIYGHLLLLEKSLSNCKNIDSVAIEGYFRPSSLFNNLNQKWTNNYFIKKFYNYDWMFNENLCDKITSKKIDQAFLDEYKPISFLIKYTWVNGKSIFGFPALGSNLETFQSDDLLFYLMSTRFNQRLKLIKFLPMPTHPDLFKKELFYFSRLRKLGLNIERPLMVKKEYFEDDKIHLKGEFQNFISYKKMINESENIKSKPTDIHSPKPPL